MGQGAEKEAAARKWLFNWLSEPTNYHPRTFMPNPQLTEKERADLVAWLLTGTGNAKPPPAADGLIPWNELTVGNGDLDNLALSYLRKALTKLQAEEAVGAGLDKAVIDGLRLDADERLLGKEQPEGSAVAKMSHADRLKYYVGRKSVARYGCYACHDIPGFELAKPIGTPINDWGRKESDRLAFENIDAYVKQFHGDHYSHFFHDALDAHRRDGFLYQKLREPRSYDYDKLKTRPWDDRLKMPQFKFSRIKPNENESAEAFAERARKDEEEGVEAVMTFVLGLVADPINLKFVNNPPPDRRNEVQGLRVLEKFNCVGCHIVKPGSYEFELDDDMRAALDRSYKSKAEELRNDPVYPEHTAWRSQLKNPKGKLTARGLPYIMPPDFVNYDDPEAKIPVELWDALRFENPSGETIHFAAGLNPLQVPVSAMGHHPPYGGDYTETLVRILARLEGKSPATDRGYLMGSGPPPLIREGQKVQPAWLYDFLKQPYAIRPTVSRNLIMPRFNMSSDDIEALVNYFVSVDRIQNPALGIQAFGVNPPQRDPSFQDRERREYRALLQHLLHDVEVDEGKFDPLKADYFEAGWRLLADKNLCQKCHDIGTFKAEGKPEEKGPALDLTADRLRPEFVERWIGLPKRFTPYTVMPQYEPFFAGAPSFGHGLKLPMPLDAQAYNQLEMGFALTPRERTEAVRDALMSWGYLVHPPPTAVKAGPRVDPRLGDMHK
jgi:mono/diheme cytochrome c family protein